MSGYSEKDLQELKDYAARMQAMGDSAQQQQPNDADIQSLQDYANQMQQLPNTPNAIPPPEDDANGPIAATAIEGQRVAPGASMIERPQAPGASMIEGQQQRQPQPTGRAMLGFAIPQQVVDAGQGLQTAGQQLYSGAKSFASRPGDLPQAAKQQAERLGDIARTYAPKLPLGVGGLAGALASGDTSDVSKRKADAEKEKEKETAAAQSGAGIDQDRVASGQAAPQAYVTPERWARTNSPESRALEEELYGEGRKREMQDQEINERLLNQKRIEAFGDQAGRDQAEMERARLDRQRAQGILARHQADLEAANKAYQTASIDPNRFFKKQDTGANVMSAIGVALGAFGASLTHSPNFALDIINKAVDNDIEAQKAEIAKKGQNAQNMLAKLKESTGSYESAENMFKIAALQHAKSQADLLGAQGQDTLLQKQLADEIEKHTASHLNYVDAHTAHILPQVIGGGGLAAKDQNNIFSAPDGIKYKAGDEKAYHELATASAANIQIRNANAAYKSAMRKVETSDVLAAKTGYITPRMQAAMSARNAALIPARQAGDEGVWRPGEVELYKEQYPDPRDFNPQWETAANEAQRQADNIFNSKMKAHNPLPVNRGFGIDQHGQVAPKVQYQGREAEIKNRDNVGGGFKKD